MNNVIPMFGREPEPPEGLTTLLNLSRKTEGQLFRTGAQARHFFNASLCSMPMSDYNGSVEASEIAEDIFALAHAEHKCARTAEKLAEALIIAIRKATETEIYSFRLVDGLGSVIMGYGDGTTFTLKIASDYKGTLPNGTESFSRIHSMEFEISEGQAFLAGQATER